MAAGDWRTVPLPGVDLEVHVHGNGEPVVLIQTALTADELVPLARQPSLRDGYRIVLYHRRGYGASSPVQGPGSVRRDALDCRLLLAALDIERAHVVGVSYSGAIAMQLAASAPGVVRSLCLIEPPPLHVPSAAEFRAANAELIRDYRLLGPARALERFLSRLMGPEWRRDLEQHLPDAVARLEREADTFFATDIPALLGWRFGAEDARRLTMPTLYVGGTDSGPWFAEVRELILAWLPHAHDVVIDGADHSLALTHPAQVAEALVPFLTAPPVSR